MCHEGIIFVNSANKILTAFFIKKAKIEVYIKKTKKSLFKIYVYYYRESKRKNQVHDRTLNTLGEVSILCLYQNNKLNKQNRQCSRRKKKIWGSLFFKTLLGNVKNSKLFRYSQLLALLDQYLAGFQVSALKRSTELETTAFS